MSEEIRDLNAGGSAIGEMADILGEWAKAAGAPEPQFDNAGNAVVPAEGGDVEVSVRGGDAYVTAVAGESADCEDPSLLARGLMEANFMWADSSGFTYALGDDGRVVLQDRRPVPWFGGGEGFAEYLADLEDARQLARGLIDFGKEG